MNKIRIDDLGKLGQYRAGATGVFLTNFNDNSGIIIVKFNVGMN